MNLFIIIVLSWGIKIQKQTQNLFDCMSWSFLVCYLELPMNEWHLSCLSTWRYKVYRKHPELGGARNEIPCWHQASESSACGIGSLCLMPAGDLPLARLHPGCFLKWQICNQSTSGGVGWLVNSEVAKSPIHFGQEILCTTAMENNPYVSKGKTTVSTVSI